MQNSIAITSWRASALAGAFCLFITAQAFAGDVSGHPRVIDGDTLKFGRQSIRIAGIDAPELKEQCNEDADPLPCGRIAAAILRRRIGDQVVTCAGSVQDRYKRTVATCSAGGEDLGAYMVQQGQALAYRLYSDDYVDEEDEARAAGRGIWAGSFTPPWTWRKQNR